MEKNSPDGSENPSLFSGDCNEQQENELLKKPKFSLQNRVRGNWYAYCNCYKSK